MSCFLVDGSKCGKHTVVREAGCFGVHAFVSGRWKEEWETERDALRIWYPSFEPSSLSLTAKPQKRHTTNGVWICSSLYFHHIPRGNFLCSRFSSFACLPKVCHKTIWSQDLHKIFFSCQLILDLFTHSMCDVLFHICMDVIWPVMSLLSGLSIKLSFRLL